MATLPVSYCEKCSAEALYSYQKMRRLYFRNSRKIFVALGWWCPVCGNVTVDGKKED